MNYLQNTGKLGEQRFICNFFQQNLHLLFHKKTLSSLPSRSRRKRKPNFTAILLIPKCLLYKPIATHQPPLHSQRAHFNCCIFQPQYKRRDKVSPWEGVSGHLKTEAHTPSRACAWNCLYRALNALFAEKKQSHALTETVNVTFAKQMNLLPWKA